MNIKLDEKDYQHMIISLIAESIRDYNKLTHNPKDEQVDWIYFIDRLKTKGILGDLSPVLPNINPKPKQVARAVKQRFEDEAENNITTMT